MKIADLRSMGLTFKLVFATIVSGGGSGFQHGYNIGVLNTPLKILKYWVAICYSDATKVASEDTVTFIVSSIVSIYNIGGIFGSLSTGIVATRIGRRNGLIINNIFAIIACLLMAFAKSANSPEMFLAGRFVAGFNCGLNSGVCAMYLVEIATTSMRGAVGTIYQLVITMSIVFSQVMGMEFIFGTSDRWPWLFSLIGIAGIIQMVLLPCCTESPKYLFQKKGEDACKSALQWLRGSEDTAAEVTEIKNEAAKEASMGSTTCSAMFTQKVLYKPLIISIVIMLAQQLSGINAVMYYSTETFMKAGFSLEGAQYATICMGTMNVLMTVISMVLVDIYGRKTLLLAGFGGMFFTTIFLSLSLSFIDQAKALTYISVALVVLFVVFFATGPGSIPWFLVAELFAPEARPLAASLACGVNWLANFVVGQVFLPLQNIMKAWVFLIFCIFQLLSVLFIAFWVPETKNKTYEEISQKFQ